MVFCLCFRKDSWRADISDCFVDCQDEQDEGQHLLCPRNPGDPGYQGDRRKTDSIRLVNDFLYML